MAKELVISLVGGCWMVEHLADGVPDREVINLFGGNALPSAYTDRMPAAEVLAALRKLNPDRVVSLKGVIPAEPEPGAVGSYTAFFERGK